MIRRGSEPQRRAETANKFIVRQESSVNNPIASPGILEALAQGKPFSSSNPGPITATTDDSTPTSVSSQTESEEADALVDSVQVAGPGSTTDLAATASEVTSVTTGVASGITSDPASTPTDTAVSGQSTLPTGDTTSIDVTSGVTGGTSVDTSSPSGPTTDVGSSGTPSPTEVTTIATSTTETSASDASSSSAIPSTTSSTTSDTTTSTSSTSAQLSQSSSSNLGTNSMTTSTQQQASTSFTTSFSEIITTLDGSVTTVFSPVATLNSGSTSGITNSRHTAIIVGIIGSVAGVIILCITIVFCCRRQRKRKVERTHHQLPTPRSVLLASEDDFDLAGPSSRPTIIRRGLGILGSLARGGRKAKSPQDRVHSSAHLNAGPSYSDAEEGGTPAMSSYGGAPHVSLAALTADTPENRALDGAPPRLLRPRTSGSGSLFEEQVWPPPRERLRDPLMSASSVDLTSIVDEVMGPNLDGDSLVVGSSIRTGPGSTTDVTRPARIRGGAVSISESDSLLVEPDVDDLDTSRRANRESTSTRGGGHTPDTTWHQRDWSVGSQAPLLAHLDLSSSPPSSYQYRHQRNSSESGSWLPPGAARALSPGIDSSYTLGGGSQSAVNVPLTSTASRSTFQAPLLQPSASGSSAPQPKLWIDRVPRRSIDSKAASEMQARRLSVSNPDNAPASPPSPTTTIESVPPPPVMKEPRCPERVNTGQTLASSFSLSTSSTQRLKDMQGGDVYAQPTFPDMSEVDPQSPAHSLSLGHSGILPASTSVRLVDVDEMPEHETGEPMVESQLNTVDEIPPRYDMIRRDTEIAEIQRSLQRGSPHVDIGRAL